MSPHQVVNFYNQRGAGEKELDILKNDFCWNHMPFSKLNQNTVYLLLTAMWRNLYDHIIRFLSAKVAGLRQTDRLKKMIFRFICIPAKWIRSGRRMQLRVHGHIDFKTLSIPLLENDLQQAILHDSHPHGQLFLYS